MQRQRLQQAWTDGASLEDTATLMHSVFRQLGTKNHARSAAPAAKGKNPNKLLP
jgi:hypothetical protein